MNWLCLDCNRYCDALTCHGRCPQCGSDAIDIAVRPPVTPEGLLSAYEAEMRDLFLKEVEWIA